MKCLGKCCKDFNLPVPMMTIQHEARKKRAGLPFKWEDIEKIADMVLFIRADRQSAAGSSTKHHQTHMNSGGWQYHYTCKHWNSESKLCMNYENRPKMCKTFPDGRTCSYRGCDYEEIRDHTVETKCKTECSNSKS